MRKKRLQHTSFTICHMFCGWQMYDSVSYLHKLGSGLLKYDFLSNQCYFDEQLIDNLPICRAVHFFLNEELDRIGIEISSFKNALLLVDIEQERIKEKETETSGVFYQYTFNCRCMLETDEKIYKANYNKIEEWAENWD